MPTVLAARDAMNTRFEVLLEDADETRLRAAAEEALDEVQRLESQLSRFRPASEVAQINARAAREPVPVEFRVFRLLAAIKTMSEETDGAFDPTLAPLLEAWGFPGRLERKPSVAQLALLLGRVGARHLLLDETTSTVRFARPGVQLDLGAVGKGYAVQCAASILQELGVTNGLIHAGTSTVYAWGAPLEATGWRVGIARPETGRTFPEPEGRATSERAPYLSSLRITAPTCMQPVAVSPPAELGPADWLATVGLRNEALSVSAVLGRTRTVEGETIGHVLDPRTGRPVTGAGLAAVITQSAAEADALSTALLVEGRAGLDRIAGLRPGLRALVVTSEQPAGAWRVDRRGDW